MMQRTGAVNSYHECREKPLFPLERSFERSARGLEAENSACYRDEYFTLLKRNEVNLESKTTLGNKLIRATEDLATPQAFNKETNGVLWPSGERAKYIPESPKLGGHIRGGVLVGLPQAPQASMDHSRREVVVDSLTGVRHIATTPCPKFVHPHTLMNQPPGGSPTLPHSRRVSSNDGRPNSSGTSSGRPSSTAGRQTRQSRGSGGSDGGNNSNLRKRWSAENLQREVESVKNLDPGHGPVKSAIASPRGSQASREARVSILNDVEVFEISRNPTNISRAASPEPDGLANESEVSEVPEPQRPSSAPEPAAKGNSVVVEVALQQAKKNVAMKMDAEGRHFTTLHQGRPSTSGMSRQPSIGGTTASGRTRFLADVAAQGKPVMSQLTDVSLMNLTTRRRTPSSPDGGHTARPESYPNGVPVVNPSRESLMRRTQSFASRIQRTNSPLSERSTFSDASRPRAHSYGGERLWASDTRLSIQA